MLRISVFFLTLCHPFFLNDYFSRVYHIMTKTDQGQTREEPQTASIICPCRVTEKKEKKGWPGINEKLNIKPEGEET